MNRISLHLARLILPLLLLLTACHPGRHARMQAELAQLQALNQADSLLTNDSLAQALALYFDNHGTPNEQMEAHYLLGRTYADRGEAPAAIAAYHDAIDRADTTAADCNYSQLWRVYSQMADVFYYQNLIDDQARCLNQSVNYAFKAGDSIMALNQYAQKMAVYIRMQEHDSTIAVFYNVYEKFTELGYENIASRYFSGAFGSMLEKKDYLSPMRFMEKYERLSGYFDAIGNIEAGREIYYYYKGLYYLDTQQYDSAQFYFRKELKDGKDFNNQNAASRGLALLYQQIHMPDSATKYAIYSYDMNDSVYARMATAEVENAHNMYNYTRHRQIAISEKARADQESRKVIVFASVSACLLILFIAITLVFRARRRHEKVLYQEQLEKMAETQTEITLLKEQIIENESFIEEYHNNQQLLSLLNNKMILLESQNMTLAERLIEKENALQKAKDALNKFSKVKNRSLKKANERLKKSEVYAELLSAIGKREQITEIMWQKVHKMVIILFPGFYELISSKAQFLNKNEYRCCFLLRLNVSASEISTLLGVVPSYISKMNNKISRIYFDEECNSKELSEKFSDFY
ncbi:MAG: hypothetical protein J6Z14_09860 [Prevotella sp.]|nr:hypothetical protein [Prevotella sp.]